MRHAKRTDKNHAEIRDGIRAAGYVVADLSAIGHGVPDLRVMVSADPVRCIYLEIKFGNEGLTDKEQDWFKHNPENCRMVNSLEAALSVIEEFKAVDTIAEMGGK